MNRTHIEDLAHRIQEYLSAHRYAADSAEGIAKWWLAGETNCPTPESVELALKELIKRGVVKKNTNMDGTVIYERVEGVESSEPPSLES